MIFNCKIKNKSYTIFQYNFLQALKYTTIKSTYFVFTASSFAGRRILINIQEERNGTKKKKNKPDHLNIMKLKFKYAKHAINK